MKKVFSGLIVGVLGTVLYQKYLAPVAAPYIERGKQRAKEAYETVKTKLHEATAPNIESQAAE